MAKLSVGDTIPDIVLESREGDGHARPSAGARGRSCVAFMRHFG